MARRFTTGFEEQDIFGMWDVINGFGEIFPVQWSRGPNNYQASEPRTGRGMITMSSGPYLRMITADHPTELYLGFAVYPRHIENAVFLYCWTDDDGVYGNAVRFWIQADGAIRAERAAVVLETSALGQIVINTWQYIEIWVKPLDVGGRVVVKVDGVIIIDFTGDTTAEEEWFNAWELHGMSNNLTVSTSYDDLVVNDENGSANNTFPGQVRLLPIRPASAGNYAQWDRGGVDLGSDHAQVRQQYDFAVRQTSDADEFDTFTPDVPDLPVGAVISNIVLKVKAKVEAGAGVVAPMIRANGTDDIGGDNALGVGYEWSEEVWAENPDDAAAWEEADLALLEIGYSS